MESSLFISCCIEVNVVDNYLEKDLFYYIKFIKYVL